MSVRNILVAGLSTLLCLTAAGALASDSHEHGNGRGHGDHGNGKGYGHHKGDGAEQINITECHANDTGVSASYRVTIPSPIDGKQISFQVLEPSSLDCDNIGAGAHPLILQGHGFGGGRSTAGFGALRDAGYTVISIDQRGHGDTEGTIRVMDPSVEGPNLVAILDWAEANLPYLAWRNEADGSLTSRPLTQRSVAGGVNLLVGAIGGSYGGGYQLLLLAIDEKNRLDALIPDITWHDLRYSLNPGDTVKTGWDLALVAAGESSSQNSGYRNQFDATDRGLDPFIKDTLIRGGATNEFPRDALDWFNYHSLGFFCANQGLPAMPYDHLRWPSDPNAMFDGDYADEVPPSLGSVVRTLPAVDVMLTQGFRDTLFNFNDAWWNYQCLSALGGDVHLLTHQGGHILPVAAPDQPDNYGIPFVIPGFQDASSGQTCGNTSVNASSSELALSWFDSKLRGGNSFNRSGDVCVSLADGDAVDIAPDNFLAPGGDTVNFTTFDVPQVTVANGAAAEATVTNGPAVVELGTITDANGAILAGIPNVALTLSSLTGANDAACTPPAVPTLRSGCDAIVAVGIGHQIGGSGTWDLVDDQLFPLRGLGEHRVDINGIAERLQNGDKIGLLIYGWHAQFPISFSRDNSLPAVNVSGTINVPLYGIAVDGALSAADGTAVVTPATGGGIFGLN